MQHHFLYCSEPFYCRGIRTYFFECDMETTVSRKGSYFLRDSRCYCVLKLYYILLEITNDPCNLIDSQQCDLFPNRSSFCSQSHLFPSQWEKNAKTKERVRFQGLFKVANEIACKWNVASTLLRISIENVNRCNKARACVLFLNQASTTNCTPFSPKYHYKSPSSIFRLSIR